MAKLSPLTIALVRQVDCTEGVDCVLHLLPTNIGIHYMENGICWCSPTLEKEQTLEEMGISYKLWVHRKFTPKGWG